MEDIILFAKRLDAKPFVKASSYISPEQAARELTAELGEDFIDFLGYNPLPPSIDLRVKAVYANVDSLEVIESALMQEPVVKEVFYQKSLVQLINKNIRRISYVLLGFSALLLLIAMALINNTIRLSVYSKAFYYPDDEACRRNTWVHRPAFHHTRRSPGALQRHPGHHPASCYPVFPDETGPGTGQSL